MASNASNGYLIIDGQVVAQVMDITWGSKNNGKIQKTLSGARGTIVGQREVSLSAKCATPKRASERRRIIQKYESGDNVIVRYRTADGECSAEGIITDTNLVSRVDEGDEFDFSFVGFEEPYRQVGG